MPSIWVESVGRGLAESLDLLADGVRDCTGELWETPMWQVASPDPRREPLGQDGTPIVEPSQRSALLQRNATPWGVAWHALECFDYDLNGEFASWTPPLPFRGHAHWRDLTRLSHAWSRSEILGYVDYCREEARITIRNMTDETAARPLPPAHRYRGQPHAQIITRLIGHTTEHASQIRQFITAAGVTRDS